MDCNENVKSFGINKKFKKKEKKWKTPQERDGKLSKLLIESNLYGTKCSVSYLP